MSDDSDKIYYCRKCSVRVNTDARLCPECALKLKKANEQKRDAGFSFDEPDEDEHG